MASKQTANKRESSGSAARKGAPRHAVQEDERRQREMTGVLLIAGGILLGVYLFISAAGLLGEVLSRFLFGLTGFIAYVLPVILIGSGIFAIRGSQSVFLRGSGWYITLGVLSVTTLASVIYGAPYQNVSYMNFVKSAYQAGSFAPHAGGGLVGGILCYPLEMLGGDALSYTLTIAVILVVILGITRLSLKEMTSRVGTRVQDAVTHVQEERRQTARNMVVINLDREETEPAPSQPSRDRRAKKASVQREESLPAPTKKKKSTVRFDAETDVVSTRPVKSEPAPKPRREPVLSDLWEDLEPSDDVPLILTQSNKKKITPVPKVEVPPVDTQSIFGAPSEPAAPKKAQVTDLPSVSTDSTSAEYTPPSFSLLNAPAITYSKSSESPNERAKIVIETLESFGVTARVVNISVGPTLTRFELQPAPGVRISRITALSGEIAMALAAPRVRIEAPIPGKSAIGIEIPNKDAVTVVLRDVVESREFQTAVSPVTLAFGKDISGKVITADLAKMPHLLIAGSTGSGKSVCINDLIISMTYKSSPAELKLILIDPKMVELSVFAPLPHLLIPVVTDPKKAAGALRWAVNEMTTRYKKFSDLGARDLARYNELQTVPAQRLPKLVVIIDELADLMLVAPDEVEDSICRIAQLGRASGIHLIVATQRPSADVITGLIKANIPSRCAFAVSSAIDSRIILDCVGAEKLLGRGDMLFHPNGAAKPTRLQCAFVSDEEVERIVSFFRVQAREPSFDDRFVAEVTTAAKGGAKGGVFGEGKQDDELLGEAVRIAIESGQASISMLQRRLRVGYSRASRLIDIMEQHKFVSDFEGSKPRRVLIKRSEYEELFGEALPEDDKADLER